MAVNTSEAARTTRLSKLKVTALKSLMFGRQRDGAQLTQPITCYVQLVKLALGRLERYVC